MHVVDADNRGEFPTVSLSGLSLVDVDLDAVGSPESFPNGETYPAQSPDLAYLSEVVSLEPADTEELALLLEVRPATLLAGGRVVEQLGIAADSVVFDDSVRIARDAGVICAVGDFVVEGDLTVEATLLVVGDLHVSGALQLSHPEAVLAVTGNVLASHVGARGCAMFGGDCGMSGVFYGIADQIVEVVGTLEAACVIAEGDLFFDASAARIEHRAISDSGGVFRPAELDAAEFELLQEFVPPGAVFVGEGGAFAVDPELLFVDRSKFGRVTYLEYVDDTSSKFWELRLIGREYEVRYGRIGSDGRTQTKAFDSAEEAREAADTKIASKLKKGYARAGNPIPVRITSAAAQEEFELWQSEPAVTFLTMTSDATVYRGDVETDVTGLLELALKLGKKGTPIVVDGNLTLTADSVSWGCSSGYKCNLLLVTGDLRANGLCLTGVGDVCVQGDLHAKILQGSYGDDGGSLGVHGTANVGFLIATTYFMFGFYGELKAGYVVGDGTYATDFTDDYLSSEDTNLFVPEVVIDGEVDEVDLYEHLVAGKEAFANDGKPHEGVYEQDW